MRLLLLFFLTLFSSSTLAIEIYGHRGARGLSPENTMPAYRTALRLGVNFVDMDIGMTKDGVLVVTHDFALNPNITKDAQGHWITRDDIFIKNLTLSQLKTYTVGKLKPGTKYAALFPSQYSVSNTHIPTLKAVIDYVKKVAGKKVGFQIEIKTNPEHPSWTFSDKRFATALAKLLSQEKIIDRTEVQAFSFQALIDLQKINPRIKTAYLTYQNPEGPKPTDVLWTAGHQLKNYSNFYPRMIKALGGKLWDPQDVELTKADLNTAHRLGLKVVVWTWPEQTGKAIDPKEIEKLINWGVDGIITGRPDILRGLMAARGLRLPAPTPSKQ